MVERRFRDADLVGDILQRHPPESFDGQNLGRRLQDLPVTFVWAHASAFGESGAGGGIAGGALLAGTRRLGPL